MKLAAASIVACTCLSCGCNVDHPPQPNAELKATRSESELLQYSLLINVLDGDNYDDDSSIKLGGWEIGGKVVAFVNGSPRYVHVCGGRIVQINQFLRPGRNEVKLVGDHTRSLYAKIITLYPSKFQAADGFAFEKVLVKKKFESDNNELHLEFDAPIEYGPLIDKINTEGDRKALLAEAQQRIKDLHEAAAARDGTRFADLMYLNYDHFPGWLAGTPQFRQQKRADFIAEINDADVRLVSRASQVKYIQGGDAVYAYVGTRPDRMVLASLSFESTKGGESKTIDMRSLIFFKVNGVLQVYQE